MQAGTIHGLEDAVPAYATLLLTFNPAELDADRAAAEVTRTIHAAQHSPQPSPARVVEIPACYEAECAPDLADVARLHGLSPQDAVARHAAAAYEVAFLGFAPGFGYLTGLPPELATPRLESPRLRVPAGSIGIAGDQTGIYPFATPGGWRLIGRTPLPMFDAMRDPPAILSIGDRVRFVPIALPEFTHMLAERK